ncbi:MAG: hypothetical protein K9L75_05205 [Spirochaetia bacterium]|nr:hypothetical protein [Spirochaetia bacterium]
MRVAEKTLVKVQLDLSSWYVKIVERIKESFSLHKSLEIDIDYIDLPIQKM